VIQIIEQDNYKVALNLARNKFAQQDPVVQAKRCGCEILQKPDGTAEIIVPYFDIKCLITHPEGLIANMDSDDSIEEWEQILLLHYLTSTDPVQTPGDPVSFAQIPSGEFYYPAFQKRIKQPFLKVFGENPDLLIKAARKLGGEKFECSGDCGVILKPFPLIKLYFILWKSDEEFPADVNLLLSSSISSFLSTEDVAVLGGIAVGKLVKTSKNL